ncbi:MAG: hypothetical protein ACREC5_07030 [Thermoplasmata archaeon]
MIDLGDDHEAPSDSGEDGIPTATEPGDWAIGLNSGVLEVPSIGFNPRASLFRPHASTPLEEDQEPDDEVEIPAGVLWPMKQQRGFHPFTGAEDRLRVAIGGDAGLVFAIDDGPRRAIIGWDLGEDPQGLASSVVGRVKGVDLEFARSGQMTLEELLSTATGLALFRTLVAPQGVSNVLLIETFGTIDQVPPEHLPPEPEIETA